MFNSSHRSHYRIEFQILFYFGFLTNSGCINQIEFKPKAIISRIDSITSSSCNICYDISVLTNKGIDRSEEHTSELQSRPHLVCRLLLEKKKINKFRAIKETDINNFLILFIT